MPFFKSFFPPVKVPTEPFSQQLLHVLLEHSAKDPTRPAIISAEEPASFVTFGELYHRAHSVAHFLKERDVRPGEAVCLVLPTSWEFIAAFAGASIVGAATTGANHTATAAELEHRFLDTRCKVVFCVLEALESVRLAARKSNAIETIVVVDDDTKTHSSSGVFTLRTILDNYATVKPMVHHPAQPSDVVFLPYSSGTTGTPKGIQLTNQNISAAVKVFTRNETNLIHELDPNFDWSKETLLQILPCNHIYGFTMLASTLFVGATSVCMKQFDPVLFCQSVEKYKVRIQCVVPPLFAFLSYHPLVDKFDMSSLLVIHTGGSPADVGVSNALLKRFSNVKHVFQGYGMTEACATATLPVLHGSRPDSVGKLAPNVEMKVVDVDTAKSLGDGQPGEICLRSPTTMLGYLNRPKETAEAIDEEGWYKTDDFGYIDEEGFIYITGRIAEMIRVNGKRIPPTEWEDVIRSHPKVADCAVVAIRHKENGQVSRAFVVKADPALTEKDVRDFVAERLPTAMQLRGGVSFVKEIPKSPAGKVLRLSLLERKSPEA